MTNGSSEQRVSSLEVQMYEIRDLVQRTAQLQQQTAADLAVLTQAQARAQQQLDQTQQQLNQTQAIANSNARAVQAWEALINQNRDEAEEERSVLRVSINNRRDGINQLQIGMDALRQASRENISQHLAFMQRFDQNQVGIRRI